MELIGLVGHAGVGKDYIAKHIISKILDKKGKKNTLIISMADQIKVNVMVNSNVSYESVYEKKTYETRRLLQKEGTEKGRMTKDKDIWVNYLDAWVKVFSNKGVERFIVPDIRFKNEADWIKSRGGFLIKITANDRMIERLEQESQGDENRKKEILQHKSVTEMKNINNYDIEIDNSKSINQTEMFSKLEDALISYF